MFNKNIWQSFFKKMFKVLKTLKFEGVLPLL